MNNLFEFEDIRTVCRICLNKNRVLILLNNHLYGYENNPNEGQSENPLITDVLADIMSAEIDNNHPKAICPNCLDQLKSAYKLKLQFKKSQQMLETYERSIISSYLNDDIFEVYDSDAVKMESQNCYEDIAMINDGDYILKTMDEVSDIVKDADSLPCEKFNGIPDMPASNNNSINIETTLTEDLEETFIEKSDKQDNTNKSLKIIYIQNKDKFRDDIQVRCIDSNKFVIEKKHINSNDITLADADNLSPDNAVISGEGLEESTCSKMKIEEMYSTTDKMRCLSCGGHYSQETFKDHINQCKQSKISRLTCKECHKVFKKVKELNHHIKLKHSLDLFPCKVCGFMCVSYSNRKVHMRQNHSGKKSFICEICDKAFFYNAGLLKHKSKHTRETQEVCNICGKSFHYKGALFYHMKMHTNERKYLCSFCDRKFYTSQALQRHIDTHTGERRFKCQYCTKSFRSTSERRRHEMIHTGEKPYHCDFCDKRFISKYNLEVHTAAHRGEHPCAICNGKYLNAEVLQLHIKLKHRLNVKVDEVTS